MWTCLFIDIQSRDQSLFHRLRFVKARLQVFKSSSPFPKCSGSVYKHVFLNSKMKSVRSSEIQRISRYNDWYNISQGTKSIRNRQLLILTTGPIFAIRVRICRRENDFVYLFDF